MDTKRIQAHKALPARIEGRDIRTVGPDQSLRQAAETLRQCRVGCLVVADEAGRVIGIISERDIINRGLGDEAGLKPLTVGEVMTPGVVCCEADASLSEMLRIMSELGIRHLPLIKDGVVVGITSSRDLMASQVQLDRSMRLAAERAAMLSSSLQNLDLADVVEMVGRSVPGIFHACRCVLHLPGSADIGVPPLTERLRCTCEDCDLPGRPEPSDDEQAALRPVPPSCKQRVAGPHRMLIPLWMSGREGKKGRLLGRICICEMSAKGAPKLIEYKASLVQNIIEANLTSAIRHEELKRRTSIDPLTGVYTRMPFERRLEEECERAARHGRSFCLAMIDVDRFKNINDTLGHAGGDRALAIVADCMAANKRTSDVLGRFGGDEFILLLPETSLESGVAVLERIRRQVGGMMVGEGITLTISCGVVDNQSCPGADANELVRKADLALYRAKQAGRDRVESWASLAKDPSVLAIEDNQEILELRERLVEMSSEAKEAFIQSIGSLVRALDARDPYTKQHSENVMRYAVSVATRMKLPEQDVAVIRRAAVIHDLGKIGVCDSILHKQGKLTPEQVKIMRQHPVIAGRILDQMRFLERELPIVRHHHERWDGQGYPDGLAGKAIPLGARILTVADSFDALTSTRVYRDAKIVPDALHILVENAGTQFDPKVVEAMLEWADDIHRQIGRDKPLLTDDLLAVQAECVIGA